MEPSVPPSIVEASGTEATPLLASRNRDITFEDEPQALALPPPHEAAQKPPDASAAKLDTFEGVFIPTTLNVLSILMFLRFGFIIGQAGFSGSMVLLAISYIINLLTTLSISAIATNGVVRGGGAYYMISRSLGPEFGGAIGVVFYVGQVLNAGLNVVGFSVPLVNNFGRETGEIANLLPESYWWNFTYGTILLVVCTVICFVGPQLFARSSKLLFVILIAATVSIPLSALIVKPYFDETALAWYTGPNWTTLKDNMLPKFTSGAAGSEIEGKENFRDLFGIFFPATAGIFAGASMSGDLKTPSKSIPQGTLNGIWLTIGLYMLVILSLAASVSRDLLYSDVEIMRNSNISPLLIVAGEFATSLFSALMGVIGAAKMLQAIARDHILPFIGVFSGGTIADDNPLAAIAFTYVLTQLTIFLDINKIAVYISMAFLMTFLVTNIACFLLDVSSAPNFRPSFRYFNATTAWIGAVACVVAMIATDGLAAFLMCLFGVLLFVIIHFYSPPKPWGDVSQALIYHQVRKYLLRLRQDHVKYWRPQVLLLVDDPRTSWSLIKFCSHLKKGGLFILGHVIVTKDFTEAVPEIEKQRTAWTRLRDVCGLKGFVQVSASEDIVWGVRNVFLGSGLGGMKPNITVLGFYDERPPLDDDRINIEELPTDSCRHESHVGVTQWVNIIEDLLAMRTNVAIAKGFLNLEIPTTAAFHESKMSGHRGYIDLYPIQMSAQIYDAEGRTSGLSINFDTYTLILQLGAILHTVPSWNKMHDLRVIAFVERPNEVERETHRIKELLEKLRIFATVLVYSLDNGDNDAYNVIVKGEPDASGAINRQLAQSKWWQQLRRARENPTHSVRRRFDAAHATNSNQSARYVLPDGSQRIAKRRTLSSLQQMGIAHSMQSTKWGGHDLAKYYSSDSDSGSDDDLGDNDNGDSGDNECVVESPSSSNKGSNSPNSPNSRSDEGLLKPPTGEEAPRFTDSAQFEADDIDTGNPHSAADSVVDAPLEVDPFKLTFNELPAKAQHLILNCLMRKVSQDSVVLFTTLPAPALGTHKNEKTSREYLELLQVFVDGLPPSVLVHSQSMTVTTSL